MILFLRSSDIGIDSRLRRYARALRLGGIDHAALYWDRDGQALGDPAIPEIRHLGARHRHHRAQTALQLLQFNRALLRRILALGDRITLIHAVDLDTALTALLASRLTGIPLIYDVYDHYPDSRGISGFPRQLIAALERRIFASAALTILADQSRVAQHDGLDLNRMLVVENVPGQQQMAVPPTPVKGPLRIGYLGTLEPRYRGIEDMLAVVDADPGLSLDIAGSGALQHEVASRAALCPRIRYHGVLPHEAGMAMLSGCDLIQGLYYAEVPNHRFAAPNKYFEHLLLARPLLTSLGTPPGDKVVRERTGWAVADGAEALAEALTAIRTEPDALAERGARAGALWTAHYADYFTRAIAGDYASAVRRLKRAPLAPPRQAIRSRAAQIA